jgi:hypothetical protein
VFPIPGTPGNARSPIGQLIVGFLRADRCIEAGDLLLGFRENLVIQLLTVPTTAPMVCRFPGYNHEHREHEYADEQDD